MTNEWEDYEAYTNQYATVSFNTRIEEARRAMKRPSSDHARYNDIDRKRSSNDRRFDPPPPPKISIYPSSTSKRTDDYKPSSRGSNTSMGNISNECRYVCFYLLSIIVVSDIY